MVLLVNCFSHYWNIYNSNDDTNKVIGVECKRHNKKIDAKFVDSFFGMMEDVNIKEGIIVSPFGFTKGAKNPCGPVNIEPYEIDYEGENRLKFGDVIRKIFPWDEHQHIIMMESSNSFFNEKDIIATIENMDQMMYEEWKSLIRFLYANDSELCIKILIYISFNHSESGWRFNAIQHLNEFNGLDEELLLKLKETEDDPETLNLITELESYSI